MADSATGVDRGLLDKFSPYYIADVTSLEMTPDYGWGRRPTQAPRPGSVGVGVGVGAGPPRAVPCRPCQGKETKSHPLSITTRGIGLSTCNLCYIAAATADISPPLYAMYRAFLGLVEAKLATCPYLIGEPKNDNAYNFKVKLYMLERAQTIPIVPEPIKRIIDAVDVVTLRETKYVPMVAGQLRDELGEVIPRPENLLLSNLREVVVALSKDTTPCKYRSAFKDNCPIPGAVWDGVVLVNADEIIPADYNLVDSLWDDMWPLAMFQVKLRERYPLMASGVLQGKGAAGAGGGSKAALISSYMSDLRAKPRLVGEPVEEYCRRCHPQGFLGSYYELEEMSDAERVAGQVALLGELPNVQVLGELAAPLMEIYHLRQGQFDPAGNHVYGDYTTALMVYNEALLSSSGTLQAAGDRPDRPDAPDRAECPARPDRPDRHVHHECPDRPDRYDSPDHAECLDCPAANHYECHGCSSTANFPAH